MSRTSSGESGYENTQSIVVGGLSCMKEHVEPQPLSKNVEIYGKTSPSWRSQP